jgi:RNA polymerase sporulation-specific sigma factor
MPGVDCLLALVTLVAAVVRDIILLVSYLHNNSFPQPLSPLEEKDCLSRLALGDHAARAVLIERNLRLVAHVIKKYDNTGEEQEDLISIGTVGLIKAIDSFDSGKGTRLATFAARCIENEILMHIRATARRRNEVLLQDPIGKDPEGNEITLLDVLVGSDGEQVLEEVDKKIAAAKLYRIIRRLQPRERQVLAMRFGLPAGTRRTQQEIAGLLGISRSYVSRIEKKVLAKIAGEYGRGENI